MNYTNGCYAAVLALVLFVLAKRATIMNSVLFMRWAVAETPYTAFARVLQRNKQQPTRLWIPVYPFSMCVVGKEHVNHVLKEGKDKYIKSAKLKDMLQPTFMDSLLNLNSRTNEDLEKVVSQKAAVNKLKRGHEYLITQLVKDFVAGLKARAGKGPFDIVPVISELTFRFMLGVVFGKELHEHTDFKVLVDALLLETGKRLIYGKSEVEAAAKNCTAYIETKLKDQLDSCPHGVDLLLGLAMAGYATVTALLGSTVKYVGEAGGWQYQELVAGADDQTLAKKVALAAGRDLSACEDDGADKTTDRITVETLARDAVLAAGAVMPPVGALQKQALERDTLSGVRVEAGSHVLVSLVQCVDKWDPFNLPDNTVFSVGFRDCTGRDIAMKLLTEAVLKLLTEYKVETKSASLAKESMLYEHQSVVVALTRRRGGAAMP
eukprot:TRINITY_DN753_c0_g2_i1.p1 TRINITY_DN753_c0_g2~~TRINITY_DN753_c0_g2_i1.p1  ORF type:complete len:451 (+),score=185.60 TRINITY_DN753_c0_g2_i1:50-1354(+)